MEQTTWSQMTTEYLTALTAAGRSRGTIKIHRHYLRVLAQHTDSPSTITIQVLQKGLSNPQWAPETRKSAKSVYSSFTRWLHGMGHLAQDPALRLMTVRVPEGQPRPAPEDIVSRSLAMADRRERWMVLLGAHAGLRAAEIATVHSRNLQGEILYVTGKGGKERLVPLTDADLIAAIRDAHGWLFPGRIDGHLSPGYVTKLLSQLMPDDWTAHALRHRAATVGYKATSDILAVGKFLGHSKPETTMRYVQMPQDALWKVAHATAS